MTLDDLKWEQRGEGPDRYWEYADAPNGFTFARSIQEGAALEGGLVPVGTLAYTKPYMNYWQSTDEFVAQCILYEVFNEATATDGQS